MFIFMLDCVLFCVCCIFVLCYVSPSFHCGSVIGYRILVGIVGPRAIVKCKPDFYICDLFICNYIFLFCRQNTLGHTDLTYFVQKLSKPWITRIENYLNHKYAKVCYLCRYPKRRREMSWRSFCVCIVLQEKGMYAMVCTWLDIAHAVCVMSRYVSYSCHGHWEAVRLILRYLWGTSKMCLYFGSSIPILESYSDTDMTGDLDYRKSTWGFLFTFGMVLCHGSPNYKHVLPYR